MSGLRREYMKDVLQDALAVCEDVGIPLEDQGVVIAALIQSDSYNGIRKAMLTPNYVVAQQAVRNYAPTPQGSQSY